MIESLRLLDVAAFRFINGTLANPLTDVVMPFLTDVDHHWIGRGLYAVAWLLLVFRGGKQGRAAALLLIPVIAVSDQVSSNVLKHLFLRARPCHLVDGVPVVEGVRLLVGCGGGYSFPSSHAVNHYAAATFLSQFFPKGAPYLFGYASLIALSRVFVGVHFPADILGGAVIGMIIGWMFIVVLRLMIGTVPALGPYGPAPSRRGG